jgi:hypothetical protein
MAMLPPEPEAEEPLPMLMPPPMPILAFPVLEDRSPGISKDSAELVETDWLSLFTPRSLRMVLALNPSLSRALSPCVYYNMKSKNVRQRLEH